MVWRISEQLYSPFHGILGTTSDLVIDVDLRGYKGYHSDEQSSHFFHVHKRIPVNEAALILVDVWEPSSNYGWQERTQEITSTSISDVLHKARENNMLIIHAPAGGVISDVVSPLENEIVLDSYNWIPDDKELHFILLKHDKKTLFYVGFHANMCVLDRRYCTKRMHDLGYQVILLRDCTTGIEYHDALEKM